MKYLYLATLILLSSSCNSCSILKKQDRKAKDVVANPETWEEKFQFKVQTGPYDEAWGLFSYSGYEDAGQVMVFKFSNHAEAILDFVGKSKNKITDTISIQQNAFKDFNHEVSKAENLKEIDSGSFDGISYTFIHLKKEGHSVFEIQKIKMNNPQAVTPAPTAHLELISLFEKLATR